MGLPEALRWHPQRSIELAAGVLPGHDLGEFDDGVLVKAGAHAREQLIGDVDVGDRDGVGVLQDEPLRLIKERAYFPVQQRQQLLGRKTPWEISAIPVETRGDIRIRDDYAEHVRTAPKDHMRQSDPVHIGTRRTFTADPTVKRLTVREREVAHLIAAGLTDRQVALRLGITPRSVGNVVQRIRQRLNLTDRAGIAAWIQARATPGDPEARLRRVDTAG